MSLPEELETALPVVHRWAETHVPNCEACRFEAMRLGLILMVMGAGLPARLEFFDDDEDVE
jgi:hypothetical protein